MAIQKTKRAPSPKWFHVAANFLSHALISLDHASRRERRGVMPLVVELTGISASVVDELMALKLRPVEGAPSAGSMSANGVRAAHMRVFGNVRGLRPGFPNRPLVETMGADVVVAFRRDVGQDIQGYVKSLRERRERTLRRDGVGSAEARYPEKRLDVLAAVAREMIAQ